MVPGKINKSVEYYYPLWAWQITDRGNPAKPAVNPTRHVGTVHHCHSYNITAYIEVQILLSTCLCNRDQTLRLVEVRRVGYNFNLCSIGVFRLGQQRYSSVFAERLQRSVSSVSRTFKVPVVCPRMSSMKWLRTWEWYLPDNEFRQARDVRFNLRIDIGVVGAGCLIHQLHKGLFMLAAIPADVVQRFLSIKGVLLHGDDHHVASMASRLLHVKRVHILYNVVSPL